VIGIPYDMVRFVLVPRAGASWRILAGDLAWEELGGGGGGGG